MAALESLTPGAKVWAKPVQERGEVVRIKTMRATTRYPVVVRLGSGHERSFAPGDLKELST